MYRSETVLCTNCSRRESVRNLTALTLSKEHTEDGKQNSAGLHKTNVYCAHVLQQCCLHLFSFYILSPHPLCPPYNTVPWGSVKERY